MITLPRGAYFAVFFFRRSRFFFFFDYFSGVFDFISSRHFFLRVSAPTRACAMPYATPDFTRTPRDAMMRLRHIRAVDLFTAAPPVLMMMVETNEYIRPELNTAEMSFRD